ncbi:hypothetical protein Dimus_005402 [Dionaea muscipula]
MPYLLYHYLFFFALFLHNLGNSDGIGNTRKDELYGACAMLKLLESKIQEAKSKKDALKARARSAKFTFRTSYSHPMFICPNFIVLSLTILNYNFIMLVGLQPK